MDSRVISLLTMIGSPLAPNHLHKKASYSRQLYLLAHGNKIPLTYLNTLDLNERRKAPEYNYHLVRLQRILDIMTAISDLFDRESIDYVVFKSLRPYPDDMADIDVLNLGPPADYRRIIKILRENGYVLMEVGAYCTTFADYKTQFETEAMIDVYDEVSVGRLIYLDKRKLDNYWEIAKLANRGETRVFAPEADILAIIAHSAIKENTYMLAEYYTTLHYLAKMNQASIQRFVGLVRQNHLVSAARWHLTITLMLHQIVHEVTPRKLEDVLSMLGGLWDRAYETNNDIDKPPYQCNSFALLKVFREKLQDEVFRKSLCNQLLKPPTASFTRRFVTRLITLLK